MIMVFIQNGSIQKPRRTHIVPPGIPGAPPVTHQVPLKIFGVGTSISDIQIVTPKS